MGKLFIEGVVASDEWYCDIRDDPNFQNAKALVEALWERYERCADTNFRTEIQKNFNARFWEMYLACSLEDAGFTINCPKPGPDILIQYQGKKIWIEAIAPTSGEPEKPDSVPDVKIGEVQDVPDKEVILRIRSAIEEKYNNKYMQYRRDNIVSENDIYVIAVNGSQMYFAKSDFPIPRIVRSVLPFGDLQLVLDRKTGEVRNKRYTYRPKIEKKTGSQVSTSIFLDTAYKDLSAVLYSNVQVLRAPSMIGSDYIIVHNPLAINPLPKGLIRLGREYTAIEDGDGYALQAEEWN